jgi:hypothetical protein
VLIAEDPLQGARDLGSQAHVRAMGRLGGRFRAGVPGQVALKALDLVKLPDKADAGAARAAREIRKGRRVALRADQYLMLADNAPVPRARLAWLGVYLTHVAAVTRHDAPFQSRIKHRRCAPSPPPPEAKRYHLLPPM